MNLAPDQAPDDLDDRADELELEAIRLRQAARRARRAAPPDEIVTPKNCQALVGMTPRAFADAGRRGAFEVLGVRPIRARRSVVVAALEAAAPRRARPVVDAEAVDPYDAAVQAARRSA